MPVPSKLPPGPWQPGALQVLQFTYRPLAFLDECRARYGDPFTLRMPGVGSYVSLAAPELIKQVFAGDPELMHAGEANAVLEPIAGPRSVLLLDGKRHARERKLLMPPMHGERMRAYAELMGEITRIELARMPVGEAFSMHPHVQVITLEVILTAVFGVEQGEQKDRLRSCLLAFLELPPALFTFIPVKYLDFPLSPYRSFMRRKQAVDREVQSIVDARRAAADPTKSDVLSLLLASRHEDGQPMTDAELSDELRTMLLAGHETTATSLSWAFALILSTPQVLERLGAEVESARGEDGELDVAQIPRLEYLDAVIKESLRLRPILPDVVRKLTAPMHIAGYDLPAGVNLMPTICSPTAGPRSTPSPIASTPSASWAPRSTPMRGSRSAEACAGAWAWPSRCTR